MKKTGIATLLILTCVFVNAQQPSYAQAIATTAIKLWGDSVTLKAGTPAAWLPGSGVILKGIEGVWQSTGEGKWFDHIQKSMDTFVQDDGTIKGYKADDFNGENFNSGNILLLLYQVTSKEKYRKAVGALREQLRHQLSTMDDGISAKDIYTNQPWLDGLFMAQPFYAAYAKVFSEDTAFNDVTRQFVLLEKHVADTRAGRSLPAKKSIFSWYGMAMVDVLDYFPPTHPGRASIIGYLNRFAKAVTTVQDSRTGLWRAIPDTRRTSSNVREAAVSSMLVYTLAKAVRKGYLPATYLTVAKKGYAGLLRQYVKNENGQVILRGTVRESGSGRNFNHNRSLSSDTSEPGIANDAEGIGAFILASNEMELLPTLNEAKGTVVMLDNWFNREFRKGPNGGPEPYHYLWDEKDNDGFSTLGFVFEHYGAKLKTLGAAPTPKNLNGAGVYIIVDPDDQKETASPNIISERDASVVRDWVKAGGVLVLMGNDSAHNNAKSLNVLATRFGIRVNEDLFNTVQGDQFEQGAVDVSGNNEIFTTAKKIYVKDIATVQVTPPASTIVTKEGKNVVAVAQYGKGTVFVIGDPWLYNEYTDGRKLPPDFDNYKAAQDLARWLLAQARKK